MKLVKIVVSESVPGIANEGTTAQPIFLTDCRELSTLRELSVSEVELTILVRLVS
jgi:hypothetical protein